MGTLYVFDGPEKSGKTTIIREIAYQLLANGYGLTVRRWGAIEPDDRVYGPEILQAVTMPNKHITLWDRSWAAEHVYASLLGRARRLANDPWLASWLYERPLNTCGKGTLILAPNVEWSRKWRDKTDLPCDPSEERQAFIKYAVANSWATIINNGDGEPRASALEWIAKVFNPTQAKLKNQELTPPGYFGPIDSPVVIVGIEDKTSYPGAWGPFTSQSSMRFGKAFKNHVKDIGWATAHECPPAPLRQGRKLIIACGEAAHLWVKTFVAPSEMTQVLRIGHPSWIGLKASDSGIKSEERNDPRSFATLAQRVTNIIEVYKNGKAKQAE